MNATLRQRLLLSRRDLDLNQEDLELRSGVSQATISRIERGQTDRVNLVTVEDLARALGVRPEYLAGWSDDPLGEGSDLQGRVSLSVPDEQMRRRLELLVDEFMLLPTEDQELAVSLIRQVGRSRHARIIGS
jgi:transcriptional regulator with XRE-family HTH domain